MSRQPVVMSGLLIALIQAAVIMAQRLGWIALTDLQFAAVMGFVAATIALGSFVLRDFVTPMSDPIDDDGEPLMRMDGQPLMRERK